MIEIFSVQKTSPYLDEIKHLFHVYASWRNFDAALGDFQKELDQLPGKYAEPEGALILARFQGLAAGCIAYQALSKDICEMKRMFVLEEFRGKGIAKFLIEKLIQTAKNQNYRIMRLDTHPHMHTAQKLYTQMGFEEIGRYNQNPTPGIRFFEKSLG
ncbi:MAG: GNAT family N-acetyltransferase [Bacteroidota bacterium]